jgi:hypothetical protein
VKVGNFLSVTLKKREELLNSFEINILGQTFGTARERERVGCG